MDRNKTALEMDSPVGKLLLVAGTTGLEQILFADRAELGAFQGNIIEKSHENRFLTQAQRQLKEYFDGARQEFQLELSPKGTEFQQRVWQALQRIPYGETVSYLEQAKGLGQPTAVRAVAAANSRNPLPIVIPCHRVIGSDGKLTGYAGGLERKSYLLGREGGLADHQRF